MLSPQNKIQELNQPISSFQPSNTSRTSRQNSPKYSPTLSPRQKKQNQVDNILIKACCPNCRYIFKVVDDNKLNIVKQKLSRMDTNLNMGRQSHKQITNNNYQKPSYPRQTQTQNGKQIKRNETPKFLQKSPKKNEINAKQLNRSPKSKGKQSKFPMKYEKKPLSPSKDNKKQLTTSQFESPINKLQISVKSPTNQRIQHSQDQIGIKKDIETMKKYLNKLSPGWAHLKSHNTSMNQVNLMYDENQNFNRSMEKTKNQFMKIDIQNYSSIPKKSLEITRKCPQCNAGHIEIETVLSAAKSKLVQNEIAMMAHFVERDTSTPSYIKCLQQYSESL